MSWQELWGWYCYDWANSVYSSVNLTFFIPFLLLCEFGLAGRGIEGLAGWLA